MAIVRTDRSPYADKAINKRTGKVVWLSDSEISLNRPNSEEFNYKTGKMMRLLPDGTLADVTAEYDVFLSSRDLGKEYADAKLRDSSKSKNKKIPLKFTGGRFRIL